MPKIIEIKFAEGDKAWVGDVNWTKLYRPCPDCLGEKVDETRPALVIEKDRLAPLSPGGTVQPGRRPVDSNSRRNFIATPAITSRTFLRYHLCPKEILLFP